jgi:hypothetical protein
MLEALATDAQGHHPACPKYGKEEPPMGDENSTHLDLFCECHGFEEPLVLANGTDVAWPAGWGEMEAAAWRMGHKLERSRS